MFKYIAMALLILVTPWSFALEVNEWTLDINAASKHRVSTYGKKKTPYNENNEGFGLSYGYKKNFDLTLGYFNNSYHKTSVYTGVVLNKTYRPHRDFIVSPNFGVLLVTGYDDTPMNKSAITPVIHPSLSFGFKNLRSNIGLIPNKNMIVTFQARLKF